MGTVAPEKSLGFLVTMPTTPAARAAGVQDGILVVRQASVESVSKDATVDWRYLEYRQEFPDVFLCLPPSYRLGG